MSRKSVKAAARQGPRDAGVLWEEVSVEPHRPYFDIEVVRNPHIDWPGEQSPLASAGERFLARVADLRRPFGEKGCDLFVSYGSATVEPDRAGLESPAASGAEQTWPGLLQQAGRVARMGTLLCMPDLQHDMPAMGEGLGSPALARVFELRKEGDGHPSAHVAVVGLDSCASEDPPRARLEELRRLIERLATSGGLTAPVYVIGVSSGDLLAQAATAPLPGHVLAEHCQRLRMSVVLHNGASRRDLWEISSAQSLDGGVAGSSVPLLTAPSFRAGVGTPGMVRLRIDLARARLELAFSYDLGSDRSSAGPIQLVRPLVSASRVRSSEQRLYERTCRLVAETAAADESRRAAIEGFASHVKATWELDGYVPLWDPAGALREMHPTQHSRYFLLLLLREREGGEYDVLLSHHTPLASATVAEWSTLLLPAFKNVRLLLEHLRDDVLRQAVDQADDMERAERARSFSDAVARILENRGRDVDEIWADQVREIATFTTRKISPTNGCLTEYEYHLVTLLPLVDRGSARDGADAHDASKVVDWLKELDAIDPEGGAVEGSPGIAFEAVRKGGAGLRWEPEVELVARPNGAERRRAQKVPRGVVWFPMSDGKPLWRECPSIVARNSDVMEWLEEELAKRHLDGRFTPEIVLGQAATSSTFTMVEEPYPYEPPPGGRRRRPDGGPGSTLQALAKVRLSLDLGHKAPYRDREIKRVFLAKKRLSLGGGRNKRACILVFDADEHELRAAAELTAEEALGALRPVQRYVLEAGMKRVDALEEMAMSLESVDPWGFALIAKGDAPKPVAMTAPIIEQLHRDDEDDECERRRLDFIVCDGNHRIVRRVWELEQALPAVAVLGEPLEPYYARPFGRLEWGCTAENRLQVPPAPESKYLVRKVDVDGLGKRAKSLLLDVAPRERYRRYFRDLEKGFGYLGGQGGRYL